MTDRVSGEVGGHAVDELASIAREEIPAGASPGFAAVSGSHSYGWSDEGSDVDLRGFHVADGHRYALLDRPDEQVTATFASRTESSADVDFVSYELRKFGVLLADRNFNALETLFDGIVVVDEHPEKLDDLRNVITGHLPMDVPVRYAGMAKSNRDAATPGGSVKRCLYAVRGLLAAHHVAETGRIESDVWVLSDSVLGDTDLVDDLIAAKRAKREATLDEPLASRAARVLDELDTGGWGESVEPSAYRRAIDDWMREVRGWDSE